MENIDASAILLPYQRRWLADKSQVKVCEKSRRIGLTWAQAADDVLLAASASGMDVLYISFNQDMTREYIDACGEWAKRFDAGVRGLGEEVLRDGDEREIKAFRIDFAAGNKILALSSRHSNLRGKQGRVVIDEAAFVDDLGEILKAALALLMWGGQVVVISTHNGADNAFNEMVQDVIAGRLPYSRHRITLDDALADGLYRRICRVTKKEWTPEAEAAWREGLIKTYGDGADEELFCIPNRSTGAYLTTAMIESCMQDAIPVFTWTAPADDFVDWPAPVAATYTKGWLAETVLPLLADLPKERAHFIGGDFGRSGDLTVFWPLGEQQNLSLVTPFTVELRNCPYRTQQQILFALADNLPRFSGLALDARGNGSALAEFARQEYGPEQVEEVMITEAWYRETMPRLKAGLEDRTLILPKNADILSDLRSLRVVKGVARVPEARGRDATGKRHGDAAVALAMTLHAREKLGGVEPWECVSVSAPAQVGGFDWAGY
jgi:phage FluMu gp28-like protein